MLTFDLVLKNIENNIPFSFARYGDGEWNCILSPNDQKGNCDGHKYFKDLSTSLKKILICKPKYYLGMQNFALSLKGNEINYFLEKNNLKDIEWSNADIFHKSSIRNEFDSFFNVLNEKEIILVGPLYLSKLNIKFNFSTMIRVPDQDCWLSKDQIIESIKSSIEFKIDKRFIVLICASMTANVIVDELYNWNKDHTYLDMGSVFDPFVGVEKRSYHRMIIERENKKND